MFICLIDNRIWKIHQLTIRMNENMHNSHYSYEKNLIVYFNYFTTESPRCGVNEMHRDTGGEDQREESKSSTHGKCGKGKSRVGHNE